jgi:hypothetical protein
MGLSHVHLSIQKIAEAIVGVFEMFVVAIVNGLKYPISYCFVSVVLPIPLPIVRGIVK